jgi:DNA-binding Lrp family transcriptional regulator
MKEEGPAAVAAIREAIKDQQKQLHERYSREMRELKQRRDSESNSLKRALAGLEDGESRAPEPKKKRTRARRRSRAEASPAAVKERCEAILRFLEEQGTPLSRSAICSSLGLSSHVVRTALRLLTEEGKVLRRGTGAGTRYQAAIRTAGTAAASSDLAEGTLQGRIVSIIEERGWASVDELVQATGATRPEVQRQVEALVREGEITAKQHEGVIVFVRTAA